MGQKLKSQKGEISITDFQGRIRLRWRVNGQRYSLNLPFPYAPENLHHASVKVAEIKLDILKGSFDTTLEKYKPKIEAPVPAVKSKIPADTKEVYLGDLVNKFNEWTAQIKNINIDHSIDYFGVRRVIERYGRISVAAVAGKIAAEKWAVTTYNKRLHILSSFFTWLVDNEVVSSNPLVHVNKKRDKTKKKNERRKPLTEKEIHSFLEAIRQDRFCHPSAPFKHSYYYPFLKFIFLTGVRNAEAIGLRVKRVDFNQGQIEISETLARTNKGTCNAARISKGTKTGNTRYIPLNEELSNLLLPLVTGKDDDSFVFISPRGFAIDDRMLKRRIIKPVMVALEIGDRDLYAARHSFGTRAVQQGMPVTDVAYLMGHATVETTIRNYVGVGKRSIALPSMAGC